MLEQRCDLKLCGRDGALNVVKVVRQSRMKLFEKTAQILLMFVRWVLRGGGPDDLGRPRFSWHCLHLRGVLLLSCDAESLLAIAENTVTAQIISVDRRDIAFNL
jgi:hypothetical protein